MTHTVDDRTTLQCDIMLEGMAAIRNISGALLAWDWKDDAERLSAIYGISEALYNFDVRSDVALGVTRTALLKLREDHPEIANMCPQAFAWVDSAEG